MTLTEMLEKEGIPFKYFNFEGSAYGTTSNAFPKEIGSYQTDRFGRLSKFKAGAKEVEFEERKWILIYDSYAPGDAQVPDILHQLYVPQENVGQALGIVQNLRD